MSKSTQSLQLSQEQQLVFSALGRAWRLTRPLFWRGLKEQGIRLFLFPLFGMILLFAGCLSVWLIPQLLTTPTRFSLETMAKLYFSSIHSDVALAMAFLLIQGPYLITIFAALTGATIAQGAIGTEAARGGLEVLLSEAYTLSEVFLAFLLASFLLTLIGWGALTLGSLGIAAAVLAVMHTGFHLPGHYLIMTLFLPLVIAFWANLIALAFSLLFPRLAQIRTGASVNLLQLLAALPALAVMVLITFRPDIDLNMVVLATLGISIVGSVCSLILLRHCFRAQYLLEN